MIKNNKADVATMFKQLKSDLMNGSCVSYSSDSITMYVNGQRILWETVGKRLKRYADVVRTTSSNSVYSFQYHGVFGKYMAVEVITKDDVFYAMVPAN